MKTSSKINPALFEGEVNGQRVKLYTLTNKNGCEMHITNYGAIVVSLIVPDKEENFVDIVVGSETLADYTTNPDRYWGATIGRYGNRIKAGRFTLNGEEFNIPKNNPDWSLHGGKIGFNDVVWEAQQLNANTLQLAYVAQDGEEGFPGKLTVLMTYRLTDENEFIIDYAARTNKDTIVNLTQHSFFNLNGEGNGDILNHIVTINANWYAPIEATCNTTGEILRVQGTPMDFTTPHAIGERIDQPFDQLINGKGYDHSYIINHRETGDLTFTARCTSPQTGISMEVYTTEPGVQLYTGNWLGGDKGKCGHAYADRSAICFEAQHLPCSPNYPHFPSATLRKGDVYNQRCIYKFGIEK